jgi:MYXO-CTERM domain-containing protein
MFQFDAGTFDDTLAREGSRILSIAGNTQAGVDFVAAMVVRSAYVDGVSNRAEAIAWMNTVRIGNAQWDPWIRTVTHYYNGCAPSYSCFTSRYAHYRDNTSGVHDEMGADFWAVRRDWAAQYVMQSFPLARDPFPLQAGTEFEGYLEMRNTGMQTWRPGEVFLGTTEPRDAASAIAGSDWVSPSRAASIDRDVPPGETGRFTFHVRAPEASGEHPQFFGLVAEGVSWFPEPREDIIQIRVESTPAPACPAGTGASWTCEASDRVRCEAGMVFRETCDLGCVAGAEATCATPMMATPDAGVSIPPAGDAGMFEEVPPLDPRGLDGGCSVSPSATTPMSWLAVALFALALAASRRRR